MNVDKLSPQQLNKVSAMLLLNVTFDENFKPTDNPQHYEFLEGFHDHGIHIDLGGWDWNPLEDDRDLFVLLRNGALSLVKDEETNLWDIGAMSHWGYGEFKFSRDCICNVKDEDLSEKIVKLYINIKFRGYTI